MKIDQKVVETHLFRHQLKYLHASDESRLHGIKDVTNNFFKKVAIFTAFDIRRLAIAPLCFILRPLHPKVGSAAC